ncbi:hypothetical protein Echvi_4054 [Echinicola vietnamensis DSM 17526]|uniref:Lipoprotein n=2 Tax=Echinicola TaxID=390846 RepID=L0G5G5_ECHVK|nr:hypothetical protein Echvi_4054 [Echinicola vietnamensis DSM 17526]
MRVDTRFYTSLVLCLMLVACGQKKETGSDGLHGNERTPSEPQNEPDSLCFAYLNEKDTVRLHIYQNTAGKVKGRLTYKLFEKDLNSGTFEGERSGDTLIAAYRFVSEGRISTREVAFLFKDNLVLEGYGPMEKKGEVFRFVAPEELTFGQGIQLLRVNCGGGE